MKQRHNELRDLEADILSMVCNDVEIEPVLQELTGESLPSGANRALGSALLCSKNRVLCFRASPVKLGYYAQNCARYHSCLQNTLNFIGVIMLKLCWY